MAQKEDYYRSLVYRDTKGAQHYCFCAKDKQGRHLMLADPTGKLADQILDDPLGLLITFFLDIATSNNLEAKEFLDKYHVQIQTNEEL